MKKWIAPICSAVVGILSFITLCFNWVVIKSPYGKTKYSGWDLLENSKLFKEFDGYTLFKVATIIMLVVAVVAIVAAIVLVLKNLNVIKFNMNLNLINNIILSVLVLFVVLALIGLLIMRADILDQTNKFVKPSADFGVWLQLALSVAACACGWALARKAE